MKSLQSSIGLVALLLCVNTNYAQTTINASDLPQAGESYLIQSSTASILFDFESTGADYVWDFSSLDSNSETLVEFGEMSDAPALAQLSFNMEWTNPDYVCDLFGPGEFDLSFLTDIGIELPITISNMLSYYQTSGSSYNLAGISLNLEGVDLPVEYSDIDEIHPLPLNYYDPISSTSAYEIDVPSVFNYSTSSTRDGWVDGWGTLLLPNGASHEVLRVNTTITTHDVFTQAGSEPFEIDRVSTVFTWLGDGGLPYLKVRTIFGNTYSVEYQGDAPNEDTSNTGGITAHAPSDFVAFPNPVTAGEKISLKGMDFDTAWEIRNQVGKIVKAGTGAIISTEGLSRGAYLISSSSDNAQKSESLVVIVK